MKEEQGTFLSFDRLKLFYRYWGAGPGSDTLVILHGQGEHGGRYEKFSERLAGCNLSLALFDFRGCGRSGGAEAHVDFFEEYLEDISSFFGILKERYKITGRVLLLGHSLGGQAPVHWAHRFPDKIKALILSSPCLGLALPPFLRFFNSVMNDWAPRFVYSNPVYLPHLTHDPAEKEIYKKDGLIRRKISVRLLHEMLRYMDRLDRIEVFRFPFPVYVLMAGGDKVVDPAKTKLFFEKVAAPKKKLLVFDDLYHEIFNELDQEKVFDALKVCLQEVKEFSIPL